MAFTDCSSCFRTKGRSGMGGYAYPWIPSKGWDRPVTPVAVSSVIGEKKRDSLEFWNVANRSISRVPTGYTVVDRCVHLGNILQAAGYAICSVNLLLHLACPRYWLIAECRFFESSGGAVLSSRSALWPWSRRGFLFDRLLSSCRSWRPHDSPSVST